MIRTTTTMPNCKDCPIRHNAVCSKCEGDELRKLEEIKYYRSYDAGQPILWRGDPLDHVASLIEGVATISQSMEDGRTQMVGLLLPSDFIGRPGRGVAPFDVTAITDVKVCCFRRKPFEQLVQSTPNISNRLLEMSMDELDAAREWMLLLGRKTAREKIASLLVLIARRMSPKRGAQVPSHTEFNLPLTREAMSNYLGLTLETVSRQLSQLKSDGLIELSGQRGVVVPDLGLLISETGETWDAALA
ncbi:transcriptional regulator FnrL [Litoreibacter roseus]|uniref:Transcriptional activator protein FnrL n=1 Tax=Litoreibacter roseus TaxID=2601869 RepID=A0A6N6JHV3_9RHOB|nr:Crp/Fnr family transcriptional regulator [Litoreibacter roseus]GFE64858.1 transcriptional activator protein FnrL [Litoreibacter roseus]